MNWPTLRLRSWLRQLRSWWFGHARSQPIRRAAASGRLKGAAFRPSLLHLEERASATPAVAGALLASAAGVSAAVVGASLLRTFDQHATSQVDYALLPGLDSARLAPDRVGALAAEPVYVGWAVPAHEDWHDGLSPAALASFFADPAQQGAAPSALSTGALAHGSSAGAAPDYFPPPATALALAQPGAFDADRGLLDQAAQGSGGGGHSNPNAPRPVGNLPGQPAVVNPGANQRFQPPNQLVPVAPVTTDASDALRQAASVQPLGGGGGVQLLAVQPTNGLYLATGDGKTTFDMTGENAGYANEVGLFRVDDAQGRLNGIDPNTTTWLTEFKNSTTRQTLFTQADNPASPNKVLNLEPGRYYAFYLVQNSSYTSWQTANPSNAIATDPVIFFSLKNANPDSATEHAQRTELGNAVVQFGLEDYDYGNIPNGSSTPINGEPDYNDIIFTIAPANVPPPLAKDCGCGCPGTGKLDGTEAGEPSNPSGFGGPIRYADGTVKLASADLSSDGFGFDWGQTRNWTNGPGYATGGSNGSGMVSTQAPKLLRTNGDDSVVAVVTSGTDAQYFDLGGSVYNPRYFSQDKLSHDTVAKTFTYTDSSGQQLTFYNFDATYPAAQRGLLKTFKDEAGNATTATYDAAGKLTELTRTQTVGPDTTTESYLYTYVASGANAGLVQNVTLRRKVNAGAYATVRQVDYTYYLDADANGANGDLRSATIKDGAGVALDTTFYRYYETNSATGYAHGLKYVFGPASYARAVAAGFDPASATDAQVAPFADSYFEFDRMNRVSKLVAQGEGCSACTGGQGSYTYAYTASGFAAGYNSWSNQTVETLPDGNQNIVYTNAYGQVMLKVFQETATGNQWLNYYQYDSAGRVVLEAMPSALSGFDDTKADLLNSVSGNLQYLRDNAGVVQRTSYYQTTTATETAPGGVAGYVQDVFIQRGELGTPVPQGRTEYFTRTANGVSVHPIATQTSYRTVDGSLDSSFDYDGQVTTGFGAFPDAARAVAMLGDRVVSAGEAWNGTDYDFALTRYNSDGSLDASFGQGGMVRTGIGSSDDFITAVTVVNNQIVVAGYTWNGTNYDFALARYNANGTLDTTFGTGGKVTTAFGTSDDLATGIAAYGSGQLVVSGYTWNGTNYDFALARYNTNGTLDTSFDTDGKVTTAVGTGNDFGNAVAVAGTQIVVAGAAVNGATTDVAVVRYNANGSLDTSFDGDGKVITAVGAGEDAAYNLALDGTKIVVAGATVNGATIDIAVLRYNSNGSLDTTFDTDGKVVTAVSAGDDAANAVAVVGTQVVVVGGTGAGDFLAVRYNSNGSLDTSFDTDGKLTTDFGSVTDQAYALAVQADGKLVAAGASNGDFALARYNSNGSLDTTFDTDGKLTTGVGSSLDVARAVALYGSAQLVTAGWAYTGTSYDFALARYNADGSLDATFGTGGKVTTGFGTSNDHATAMLVVGTQIVVAGYSWNGTNYDFALARYNANGSLDTTFGTGGKVTTAILASDDLLTGLALDGTKLVVAGYSWNGTNYDFAVARYNSNGTLDTSFDTDGKLTTAVGTANDFGNSVAVSGGKVIVAGSTVNGAAGDIAVVRYNSNGTLDTSFDGDGKAITAVGTGDDAGYSVAMAGTQFLVSGTTVNGASTDFALLRYNSNGSLDTGFDGDGKVVTSLSAGNDFGYAVTTAGTQIVVVGAANGDFAVARFNPNGSLDTSFDGDGKRTTDFGSTTDQAFGVAIKADGQIIAAGTAGGEFALARYNAIQTTSYSYTWFANSTQMQSMTVSLPLVAAAQNGPDTAAVSTTYFDIFGRAIYQRDAEGFITKYEYDAKTSALTKIIDDVNTTLVTDEPVGWVTPAGGGLHLTTSFEVDHLGRTTKLTQPAGNITYTTYNDANHETRVYAGWTGTTTTGPTVVYRADRPGSYFETITMSAAPAVTGGRPTGTEAISGVQTLSRSYVSVGGQTTSSRAYFNLAGLAYSTAANLGTQDVHYYLTTYDYDNRGRANKTVSPTGTIYRTVYDALGRVSSAWVGTDDMPTTGFWSPTNNVGANMTKVREHVYDAGLVGDSNLTQVTEFPGVVAVNRVSQFAYDWRNRLVATKGGVQGSEATTVNRPISYTEYDNLNQVIAQELYDGDTLAIATDANADGVPDKPANAALRARSVNEYDAQGRVFRTQVFSVDPGTGTLAANTLRSDYTFDLRGNLIRMAGPGGLVSKMTYDGVGRQKKLFTTDGGGDTVWSQADDVTGDVVLEQSETQYDANGNALLTISKQRFHDETATGELGNATTGPKARVSYVAAYYDLADRVTDVVDVGTNGGTAYTRPGTPPARSDTVLRTSYVYNAAGWVQDVTDPRAVVTRTTYDNLGRTTKVVEGYVDGTPSAGDDRTTEYTYDGSNHVRTVQATLPAGALQRTEYVYGVIGDVVSNDILGQVKYPDLVTGLPSATLRDLYSVNALGQTKTYADRNGSVHTYGYDVLGRLTSDTVTTLGAGVDGAVRRIDTAYDAQGNAFLFTSFSDTAGTTIVNQVQRAFNGLGQLTTEWQSHSGAVNTGTTPKVQYAYSQMANGANHSRLMSMTYPNGRVISYDYGTAGALDDKISRLNAIKDGTTTLEAYSYLGLETVVRRAHPQPSVDLTFIKQGAEANGDAGDQYTGLDRFGRVVDQRWLVSSSGVAVDRFQYGYDRDGNVLYKDNLLNNAFDELYHADGAANGYDTLNRLVEVQRGALSDTNADGKPDTVATASHTQSWTLDAQGNMPGVTTDGVAQTRTHNQQNEITTIPGATAPTYDANGNLTRDETGRTLVYDAWNRLKQVNASGGGAVAVYSYDALTRRVVQTVSGLTTDFFYSTAWQVLEERIGGTARTQYVWSPVYVDAMILRDRDTDSNGSLEERLYALHDANFNVTALVNTAGALVERYIYDPYGVRTIHAPDWSLRASSSYAWVHGHQGLRFEAATGLHWNRRRDYSATLMRFVQNDPAGMVDGTNLYAPYQGSPLGKHDPSGLYVTCIGVSVTFVYGMGSSGGLAYCDDDCGNWAVVLLGSARIGYEMFLGVTGTVVAKGSLDDWLSMKTFDFSWSLYLGKFGLSPSVPASVPDHLDPGTGTGVTGSLGGGLGVSLGFNPVAEKLFGGRHSAYCKPGSSCIPYEQRTNITPPNPNSTKRGLRENAEREAKERQEHYDKSFQKELDRISEEGRRYIAEQERITRENLEKSAALRMLNEAREAERKKAR